MKLRPAALHSALLSILPRRQSEPRRENRHSSRLILQRFIALGMVLLLLPLAQIDALAQQQWPQKPSPYQYAQPNPYPAPQQPAYSQQPYGQPQYAAQPAYPAQPYDQQQYPQQAPAPQDYADQGAYPDQNDPGQPGDLNQQPQQGFGSEQLEQLVAPIALYPDALVAQILAASTYPAQVVAADHWLQAMGRVSPDQVAAAANAQSTWDPSVKALTAFPQVLSMLDHDLQWTTDLGNAYYNQPQDVLSTIQVLRQRAQSAGTLNNTPQEEVSNDQGYIQLEPTDPEQVYLPSYNPWYAYGAPIDPYPGFSFFDALGSVIGTGLRYGAPFAMGAFLRTPFGPLGWALNWLGSSIFFNHQPYYSHSASVAHWGGFRGGYGGGYRGGYGGNYGGGRAIPNRPVPLGRESAGSFRSGSGYGRAPNGFENQRYPESPRNFESQRPGEGQRSSRDYPGSAYRSPEPGGPAYRGNGNYGSARTQAFAGTRPESYSYARPVEPMRQQYYAPQQQISRPQAYANPGYNAGGYRGPQSFANQRVYSAPTQVSRGFQQAAPRYEASGGSHFFGGGHAESYHAPKAPSYHAPKAPRMSGGGGHSGGGLFHRDNGGKHH